MSVTLSGDIECSGLFIPGSDAVSDPWLPPRGVSAILELQSTERMFELWSSLSSLSSTLSYLRSTLDDVKMSYCQKLMKKSSKKRPQFFPIILKMTFRRCKLCPPWQRRCLWSLSVAYMKEPSAELRASSETHEHFIDPTNCPWVSEGELRGFWEISRQKKKKRVKGFGSIPSHNVKIV